uniref:NADH-ubiquinone oxidoreductase chain 1 n=1 Tax=Platorchestia parapacifica TaxID=1395100 RepID=A0A343SA13_9CRUS|nr:NADH dehydrogenase subunit 1 [Platorchestia parapacifica]
MEIIVVFINYLLVFVLVLVSVAFITLLERKILGSTQIRVGPNFVGYWGVLQPFSDAVKLFTKETTMLWSSNIFVYLMSPVFSLSLMMIIWSLYPFFSSGIIFMFSLMFFISISGLSVYPIISSGWSSNCKYSILGSLRAVAQMISYEVSLIMVLLSIIWVNNSFNLDKILCFQNMVYNFFFFIPLGMIWLVSMLAETNRTPYDFSEGESELVSGFNTEYGAGGFSLIFMAEYGNILFMSLFFVILFFGKESGWLLIKTMFITFWFIWVRATLPRYRYDKLMGLAWKSFLPITLFSFMFYYLLGCLCIFY